VLLRRNAAGGQGLVGLQEVGLLELPARHGLGHQRRRAKLSLRVLQCGEQCASKIGAVG